MPLPFSRNQVRNLGKRLRDAPTPTPDDLDLLAEVLAAYGEALGYAGDRLDAEALVSSERLKNTGTIVEKLRREHATNLPGIQDIAGRRIVLPPGAGRARQDEVVAEILSAFGDAARPPRVHDRRLTPSRGYRAVHVVVEVLELPVEIQVRTALQHEWAEHFERLADLWGREIRYDDGPPDVQPFLRRAAPETTDPLRAILLASARASIDPALALAGLIDLTEDPSRRGTDEEAALVEAEVWRLIGVLRDSAAQIEALVEGLA